MGRALYAAPGQLERLGRALPRYLPQFLRASVWPTRSRVSSGVERAFSAPFRASDRERPHGRDGLTPRGGGALHKPRKHGGEVAYGAD